MSVDDNKMLLDGISDVDGQRGSTAESITVPVESITVPASEDIADANNLDSATSSQTNAPFGRTLTCGRKMIRDRRRYGVVDDGENMRIYRVSLDISLGKGLEFEDEVCEDFEVDGDESEGGERESMNENIRIYRVSLDLSLGKGLEFGDEAGEDFGVDGGERELMEGGDLSVRR